MAVGAGLLAVGLVIANILVPDFWVRELTAIGDQRLDPDIQSPLSRECEAEGFRSVERCLAMRHAPQYRFHSDERFYPSTVFWYLPRVRLRYSNGGGCSDGQFNVLNPGDVNSVNLGLQEWPRRVRKRSFLSGFRCDVSDNMAPSDRSSGNIHGYFMQVSSEQETYAGMVPVDGEPPRWTIYAFVAVRHRPATRQALGYEIEYHMFFPRDGGPVNPLAGDSEDWAHEGDWERIAVHVDTRGRVENLFYSGHGASNLHQPGEVLFVDGAGSNEGLGTSAGRTHPIVFVSLFKHASYAETGEFPARFADDFTDNGGTRWNSWILPGGVSLIGNRFDARSGTEWIQYGGRWGEIGEFDFTSGPVGPTIKGSYCTSELEGEAVSGCRPVCNASQDSDDQWVLMYADFDYEGPMELHRLGDAEDDVRFEHYRRLDFNDHISSIEWCLAPGSTYSIFSNFEFRGRELRLVGDGTKSGIPDMREINGNRYFNDIASSSRFNSP